EACDELLGLREGPIDDRALLARELHAFALRARREAFAREHHARFDELLVELAHLSKNLRVGHLAGFGICVRLHENDDLHDCLLCGVHWGDARPPNGSTWRSVFFHFAGGGSYAMRSFASLITSAFCIHTGRFWFRRQRSASFLK